MDVAAAAFFFFFWQREIFFHLQLDFDKSLAKLTSLLAPAAGLKLALALAKLMVLMVCDE